MTKFRLAVIGAGVAGLSAARHGVSFGCDVTVFEQAAQLGGTWVYSDNVGKDKYGLDVHSSMYKGLHTNLPKEIMGYPDFAIPKQEKSYIPSEDMVAFLNLYADKFDFRKNIRFEHHVVRVRPLINDTWEIIVRNLPADRYETHIFDAVLICNGHYHTPAIPKYEGRDLYKGKLIHSHDYRCPDPFAGELNMSFRIKQIFTNLFLIGERVLVIGAGPSGMDMAHEISKVAEMVTLSHHLKEPPKTKFNSNVNQKPDVVRMTENGVAFADGTEEDYTVVFFCTGYKYTFPFLSVDCNVQCDDNYIRPLFKHCLSINHPTMGFIGLPFYVCATQMFDLQVRFCLTFITGRKPMPSKEEMIEDTDREMAERWSRGYRKHQAHLMGPEQNKYYADLATTADIEGLKPVITKLHNESKLKFIENFVKGSNL